MIEDGVDLWDRALSIERGAGTCTVQAQVQVHSRIVSSRVGSGRGGHHTTGVHNTESLVFTGHHSSRARGKTANTRRGDKNHHVR
jgi:hypothetical protein